MLRLFERGNWEDLEEALQAALAEDPADARSAYRLGNLLCLLGRPEEALAWYDKAWAQRWPGPVCLNNQAVAHAHAGQSRAALAKLREALRGLSGCGPASYNLGVLLQRLGEEGSLPELVREMGLVQDSTAPQDLIRQTFSMATGEVDWGDERSALDGPLYLWLDDLRSSFGFEQTVSQADIDEAHRLLAEGRGHLESGEWEAAINAFDEAATFHEEIEPQIIPLRNQAQLALAREYRNRAQELKQEGDHTGYRNVLETHNRLVARFSGADLQDLIVSEIRSFGRQLRHHRPSLDWRQLQTLISMARQRVETLEEGAEHELVTEETVEPVPETDGEPEPADGDRGDEEVEAGPEPARDDGAPEDAGGEPEEDEEMVAERDAADGNGGGAAVPRPLGGPSLDHANLGSFIRGLCRNAWGEQIRFLVAQGAFEQAEQMLTFSELQWFARDDVAAWRRGVFTAKAEHLAAVATEEREQGRRQDAIFTLGQARTAAMTADDTYLVDRLDRQIDELMRPQRPKKDFDPIKKLLGDGEYVEAVRMCSEMLEETPEEPELRSWRDAALSQQWDWIRGALASGHWERALAGSRELLEVLPGDATTQQLAAEARHGLLRRHLSEAQNALDTRDMGTAETHCRAALGVDPANRDALELRRRIRLAREVDVDAADDVYEAASVEFSKARAERDPEAAWIPLKTLRRLGPERESTVEATEWFVVTQIAAWRRELEDERTSATADELLEQVEKVLSMLPRDRRLLDVREELRRVRDGFGARKREQGLERLQAAQDALHDGRLVEALELLDEIAQLGEPSLRQDETELRREALGRLHRRLAALVRRSSPEPAGEEERKDADELRRLLQAYAGWRPEEARKLSSMLDRRVGRPAVRKAAREDFEGIRQAVRKEEDPVRALRLLHRRTLERHRRGSEVLAEFGGELIALYRRLRDTLGPLQRLRMAWYERWHRVERFFGDVTQSPEEESDDDAS